MPTARAPDMSAFHRVGRPEAVTRGMSSGLAKPMTNMVSPRCKRHPGWDFSVSFCVSFTVDILPFQHPILGTSDKLMTKLDRKKVNL
jgi:hypothetical protein